MIPGYDDTLTRPASQNPQYDRRGGAFYARQWSEALGYDSQVVLVTSFNEWHESTSIEPSTMWGEQYLSMTRGFVEQLQFRTSDNELALQFHLSYFPDASRVQRLNELLTNRTISIDTSNRWLPISTDPCGFRPYNNTAYVDQMALDAIHYSRCNLASQAQRIFDKLTSSTYYNRQTGLFNDTATSSEGHAYYKVALGLILASRLGNSEFASRFANTLLSLQRPDGSWLTDDKPGFLVWPNSETTMLILIGLLENSRLYEGTSFYPWILVLLTSDVAASAIVLIAISIYQRRHDQNTR